MTIVNFYKIGSENVKLSTLKKIAQYFGVSLDYIADDNIIDRNYNAFNNNCFNSDEISMILAYRHANEDDRAIVNTALRKYQQGDGEKMA